MHTSTVISVVTTVLSYFYFSCTEMTPTLHSNNLRLRMNVQSLVKIIPVVVDETTLRINKIIAQLFWKRRFLHINCQCMFTILQLFPHWEWHGPSFSFEQTWFPRPQDAKLSQVCLITGPVVLKMRILSSRVFSFFHNHLLLESGLELHLN